MEFAKLVIIGAIVGVANIIPGVSGGTMAVILKIYDRLIETLSLKNIKKNLPFLIPFAIGAAVGVVLFSKAITFLLGRFPMATQFTFLGLVLGSIPMIFLRAKAEGMKAQGILSFFIALAVMVALTAAQWFAGDSGTVMMALNVPVFLYLFVASAVSAFAMILPGISGSFVMLILGAYTTVITAIKTFTTLPVSAANWQAMLLLVPVGLGCLTGLIFGSRLVDALLRKQPQATYFAILGLVAGSLLAIFPAQYLAWNLELLIGLLLMIGAGTAAYLFSKTDA